MSSNTKRTLVGILWICSGFMILIIAAFLSMVVNFAVIDSVEPVVDSLDAVDTQTSSSVLIWNIISWIMGIIGVVMLIVGPIIGIKKLSKTDTQQ